MAAPQPVILDTDPGVDDALALLLASASPEIRVLAVTTVAGNVDLDQATENARRILPVAWAAGPPPLYRGGSGGSETAVSVHGADGLGGATRAVNGAGGPLYPPMAQVQAMDAADAILELASRFPGEVTLVTLGPLTNAAEAFRRDPGTMRRLRRIVVMGGAFREPGNTTAVAEFNIYVDPTAAQVICESGIPMTWVPLDLTHRCTVAEAALRFLPDTPRVRFAREITAHYMRYHEGGYGETACFLHDPAAVGAVLWPELFRAVALHVDVETEGRITAGMTVADFRPAAYRADTPPNAEVCLEVDAPEFVRRFLERLGAR